MRLISSGVCLYFGILLTGAPQHNKVLINTSSLILHKNQTRMSNSTLPTCFEALSCDAESIDFERTLFQALINEGKHIRIINAEKQPFRYSEKNLRDEAAAEIAQAVIGMDEADNKETNKKRKILNDDERTRQRYQSLFHI